MPVPASRLVICVLSLLFVSDGFTSDPVSDERGREPLLLGGDISMLNHLEERGAQFKTRGQASDLLKIMQHFGCNCFRLRLFVNPNGKGGQVNDLAYTLKLAKRIKEAGGYLLLDLHYSDGWADPGQQNKPAAWADLPFEKLEATVETYTADVIRAFRAQDTLPDIVQIGNEIHHGMLWPDGKLWGEDVGGWPKFARLLKAGVRGARQPLGKGETMQIMIHAATGGHREETAKFYRQLEAYEVPFDLIGLSYYPWWHGTLDDLKVNLAATAQQFQRDVVVVETAYPWRELKPKPKWDPIGPWPQTKAGQRAFLRDVLVAVRDVPNQRGRGVIWWYPESVPQTNVRVWNGGATALFDNEGEALPAFNAFRTASRRSD